MIKKSSTTLFKRAASIVLVIVLVMILVSVSMPIAAREGYTYYDQDVYYPLKGASEKDDFYKESDWSFEGRNFMEIPPYETSDPSFAAPKTTVLTGLNGVDVEWEDVKNAAKYTVKIFEGVKLVKENSTCETKATVNGLEAKHTYLIQVLAFDKDEELLKASKVKSFSTYNYREGLNDIEKTNSNYTGFVKATGSPDGDGVSLGSARWTWQWTDGTVKNITIGSDAEYIAFWVGSELKNDTYLLASFAVSIATSDGNISSQLYPSSTGKRWTPYFVSTKTGEYHSHNRACNDEWAWYCDNNCFKVDNTSQYVLIPLSLFSNGDSFKGKTCNIKISVANMRVCSCSTNQIISDKANRLMYFDDIGYVSDLQLFLSSFKEESFNASKEAKYSCDEINKKNKTFSNSNFGSKYKYATTNSYVSYNLQDTGSAYYGMSLKFTSPKSSDYDITNHISIKGNSLAGTVYYKLIKETQEGEETQVWPKDDKPFELVANASNFNPSSELEAVNVHLEKGEKLRFDVYADVTTNSGGEITVYFTNTFLVPTKTSETSKGTVTTYPAVNYMDFLHSTGSSEGDSYKIGQSRWNFRGFKVADESSLLMNAYREYWGYFTSYNIDTEYMGIYSDIDENSTNLKGQSTMEYGVSLDFLSDKDGVVVLSYQNKVVSGSAIPYQRVIKTDKNGVKTKIYPVGESWKQSTETVSVSCDVKAGDTVSIQEYGGTSQHGNPTAYLYTGNTSNLAGQQYYSALRERPWHNKNYNGSFDQNSNIWKFDLYDGKVCSGDSFSSLDDGLIYNSQLGKNDGYRFNDDEILYNISKSDRGLSLSFTVPISGYYDFGCVLRKLSGNGNLKYRILLDYEDIIQFTDLNVEDKTTVNKELYLTQGTVLKLNVVANNVSEPITLSIGDPTIVYNTDFVFNEIGKCAVYYPTRFFNQEKDYNGNIRLDNTRFVYGIKDNSTVKTVSYSNYSNETMTLSEKSKSGYKLTDGVLSMLLGENQCGIITFNSPRAGYANVIGKATADGVKTDIKVSVNGEDIYNKNSDVHIIDTYINLKENDVVTITASGANKIDWTEIGISIDGVYANENDSSASVFTASLVLPYDDGVYNGKYKQFDKIWRFNTYFPEDNTVKSVDYYSTDEGKHLYHKESGVGYYFDNKLLYGDLKKVKGKAVGLSLEFTSPSKSTYELINGLQITSPTNASADIYVSITKNGEEIYSDSTKGAAIDSVIKIPYQIINLDIGDRVAIKIYAKNINSANDSIKVSLGAPRIKKHNVSSGNSDYTMSIYSSGKFRPYIGLDYKGKYFHMENLWNFEFLDFLPNGIKTENPEVVYGDDISYNSIIYNSNGRNPSYNITDGSVSMVAYSTLNDNGTRSQIVGQSIRFVSPIEGEVELRGIPTVSNLQSGQKAYFRILHNGNVIFPVTGGWETFEQDGKSSVYDTKLNVSVNDEICYQFYTDADVNTLQELPNKCAVANFSLNPVIFKEEYVNASKTSFRYISDQSIELQVSPFWEAEYSYDCDNPVWTRMENYHGGWKHWLDSTDNMGFSTEYTTAWIQAAKDNIKPAISATYKAQADGFIKINRMGFNQSNGIERFPAKVRITCNGTKIWPEEKEWELVTLSNVPVVENLKIQVNKGDKIRFEVSAAETMNTGDTVMLDFDPIFTYSQYDNVYSDDDNIYGMLDDEMYEYFKNMKSADFDTNPDETLKTSKNYFELLNMRIQNWYNKLLDGSENTVDSDDSDSYTVITQGTPDQYIPGTEAQTVRKRRKVVKTIEGEFPTWAIMLIVVGAVFVIGITVFVILFIKKKRKVKCEKL